MIKYIIILIAVCTVVLAQDISITDFGGGLNTNVDIINLKPNEGNYFLNLDPVGTGPKFRAKQRNGYLELLPISATASVNDTILGNAPNTGLFGFRRADGQRRLVGITSQAGDTADFFYWTLDVAYDDSSNCPNGNGAECDSTVRNVSAGLGWLVASPSVFAGGSGSYYYFREGAASRKYSYVYQGITPHWTYWNDRCYMTNGRQRPLVFEPYNTFGGDGYARELVPLTPGEPLIVPMDVSGNLNGKYYYMIGHTGSCGAGLGDNEVVNGDFESWTGNLPNSWDSLPFTTGRISEETDSIKNGTSALKLKSKVGGLRIGIHQTIRTNSDSLYTIEVWINKPTDGSSISSFTCAAYDTIVEAGGNFLGGITLYSANNGYNKYQFSVTPRSGRDSIELYLASRLNTTVDDSVIYIDSITVRQADLQRFSVVTKPVVANDENVLLTNFPWQTIAAGCGYGDAGYNALNLDIYRTKGNVGDIGISDKFYLLASIALTDTAQIDTLIYIDTIPDDTLGFAGYNTIIKIDTLEIGRDLSGVLTGVRVGAPTYVSNDSLSNGTNIFRTSQLLNETFIKASYICTYYDTLIDAESDSSRSLHIFKITNENMYHIGLPPLPGGKRHLTRRLWKSYTYYSSTPKDSVIRFVDTTITVDWSNRKTFKGFEEQGTFLTAIRKIEAFINYWGSAVTIDPPYDAFQADKGIHIITYRLKLREFAPFGNADSVNVDTVTTLYRMIAEIKKTDSVFVDSVVFDSAVRAKPYFKSAAPFNLTNVTSFQDRLWGSVGAVLYWSYLDSGSVFGSFRNLLLNVDDGDEITAILPFRTYVKVYKNRSQFAVFPGNVFEFERTWTVDGLGCIAPHSAIALPEGLFYLSHKGVVQEQGSIYRNVGSTHKIISEPINNILLNRTSHALSKAYGIVHNDKYWLSFSDVDTTFVYHLKTGGWTIYDYAIKQATFYDTLTDNSKSFTPSNDMIFITGDDDQHYKADTTFTDASTLDKDNNNAIIPGTVITTHYRSPPLRVSADDYQVSKFGIWRESNDDTTGLNVRFFNAEGDSTFYKYIDTVATRYDVYNSDKMTKSNYFQFDIIDSLVDSLAYSKFDYWFSPMGEKPGK